MVDEGTKRTLSSIPLLQTKAGPRDKELWVNRLKEEYQALIKVFQFSLLTGSAYSSLLSQEYAATFCMFLTCFASNTCNLKFHNITSTLDNNFLVYVFCVLFNILTISNKKSVQEIIENSR